MNPIEQADAEPRDDEQTLRSLCAAERWSEAATWIMRSYGRELLTYLAAIARSESDGSEAFSQFTEDLWRGLPRFRWASSARTWCYALARNALFRLRRRARETAPLTPSQAPELARLAAEVRTATLTFMRTEVKDEVALLREQLSPDDQAVLILRVDRKLAWLDVARALAEESEAELSDAELRRRAATLRKRFGRIKEDLKRGLASRIASREG